MSNCKRKSCGVFANVSLIVIKGEGKQSEQLSHRDSIDVPPQTFGFEEHGNSFANPGFGLAHDNFDIPSFSQEAQNWSSIGVLEDPFQATCMIDVLEQDHPWSGLGCSSGQSLAPAAFPVIDSKPLPPDPLDTFWTYMSDSERSSGISYASTQTWNTASTLISVSDLYSESPVQSETNQPMKKTVHSGTWLSTSESIPEEDCSCACSTPDLAGEVASSGKANSKMRSHISLGPNVPPKDERGSGKYICTVCKFAFARKGDWERHEDSLHDPQTYWTCMLGDPAVQTATGWECAFCAESRTNRVEIVQHLTRQHNFNHCTHKPAERRRWTRQDKLKQHLKQVHALSETSYHWKQWHHATRQKAAWGCGYCGTCLYSWEGMLGTIYYFLPPRACSHSLSPLLSKVAKLSIVP